MVGTYDINGIKLINNKTHLTVLSPFGYTCKYSTIKGLYHFTFPSLLLSKYRTLFNDVIGNDVILYYLIFSTVSLDDDKTNENELAEDIINDIIADVINEDKEEITKLVNE